MAKDKSDKGEEDLSKAIKKQETNFAEKAYRALDSEPGNRIVQRNNHKTAFRKILDFLFRLN